MILEEAEYLKQLEEIERECGMLHSLLLDAAQRHGACADLTAVAQILSTIDAVVDRCRREREALGLWREDNLEPYEILEEIDDEIGELMNAVQVTFPA